MTMEHVEAFLAQAGVDAGAVGDPERLLLPEPQIDEARTARAGVSFVPPALLQVRSEALDAAGIEAGFDEDAGVLVLTAPTELAFGVAAPGERWRGGEAAGTRFRLPADHPSAFGLWTAAGPLAIGSVEARAIELRVVHAWPAPPLSADIVIANWSRWHATMAAGRVARGFEAHATEADAIPARRWLRGVSADQRTLIERFAIVRARGVASHLARIQDGQGLDQSLDFTWQRLCWDRDDVEGIGVLLREAQAGQALSAVLRAVDELGRAVRFSWPSEVDVHDDRLQRVSEADPGAWWGSTRRQVVWL